jgi:hypothetical protein
MYNNESVVGNPYLVLVILRHFRFSMLNTMKLKNTVLIALGVILLILLVTMNRSQSMTMESRVHRDLLVEKARFLPQNSIDVSQAMKLVTFEPAAPLVPPTPQPPLLLYPPSADALERLSGR